MLQRVRQKFSYREAKKKSVEFNSDKVNYVTMIWNKMSNKDIMVLELDNKYF